MLIIQKKQSEIFKAHFLKKFEDEMVEHIKAFFPNNYNTIEEKGIRDTIQFGYIKAKSYEITTKRGVCLYLNSMMMLGSNFDSDPLYHWAKTILSDKKNTNSQFRIDMLSDKALEIFNYMAGDKQVYLNRSLLNIQNNPNEIFHKILGCDINKVNQFFNMLFPQKVEVVEKLKIREMIDLGIKNANKYNFKSESCIVMFLFFMFIIGAGFDKDPQFPWASNTLNDVLIFDENKKIEILFQEGLIHLRKFLSQTN